MSRRHGLAAYLVAGPALQTKLFTARHAPGEPACPEGVAVVYTAVDWARCGRTDPISDATLRQLWSIHLPAGIAPTVEGFGIDGGTEVAIHASGAPGGFFGWATPLTSARTKRPVSLTMTSKPSTTICDWPGGGGGVGPAPPSSGGGGGGLINARPNRSVAPV